VRRSAFDFVGAWLARDGGLTADQSLPANIQSLWERLLAMAAAQATDAFV
jgi:hypothetical protein